MDQAVSCSLERQREWGSSFEYSWEEWRHKTRNDSHKETQESRVATQAEHAVYPV